ncbi:hypothetical protein PoB_005378400 [Plakobranchus ocellatus]|uniref:Uncharacterized protein n=1 Tax=Plakobranchus ocellatus TaxID=259542 RepID=A0AAV4C883_9GAST|nr:hypothetical protein PoB_005378400 [Plakobranchus ocellatus]
MRLYATKPSNAVTVGATNCVLRRQRWHRWSDIHNLFNQRWLRWCEHEELTTNVVYYKKKLWTFHLGIHDEQGEGVMCMWHEDQASGGPDEVGLFLLKYIKDHDQFNCIC